MPKYTGVCQDRLPLPFLPNEDETEIRRLVDKGGLPNLSRVNTLWKQFKQQQQDTMFHVQHVLFIAAGLTILQGAPQMSNYGFDEVRLAGVDGAYRGRVEVYVGGEWGTICDEGWDANDAKVVCNMLSLSGGEPVRSGWFGKGEGAVLMSDVDCKGDEFSIFDCDYDRDNWCSHRQDAGVICEKPENVSISIRLTDGDNETFGRVEIFQDNIWSTVCNSLWDDLDATVACRMLGFNNGTVYNVTSNEVSPMGPVLMDFIDCEGYENSLKDCDIIDWETHDCEDAGVSCS